MIHQLERLRQAKIKTLRQERIKRNVDVQKIDRQIAYYQNMKIIFDYPYLLKKELKKKEVLFLLSTLGFEEDKRELVYDKLMKSLQTLNPYPKAYQILVERLEEDAPKRMSRAANQVVEKFKQLMEYHFYHDTKYFYIGTLRVSKKQFGENLQKMFRENRIKEEEVIPMIVISCTYGFILSKEEIDQVDKNIKKAFAKFGKKA